MDQPTRRTIRKICNITNSNILIAGYLSSIINYKATKWIPAFNRGSALVCSNTCTISITKIICASITIITGALGKLLVNTVFHKNCTLQFEQHGFPGLSHSSPGSIIPFPQTKSKKEKIIYLLHSPGRHSLQAHIPGVVSTTWDLLNKSQCSWLHKHCQNKI